MCWQKFMEIDRPGIEKAGYITYTTEQEWWMCRNCFVDLHEEMGWRLESQDDSPAKD
jgi:hypothetical protein